MASALAEVFGLSIFPFFSIVFGSLPLSLFYVLDQSGVRRMSFGLDTLL